MAAPELTKELAGNWAGKSKLHMSWLPPEQRVQESDSKLSLKINDQGAFASLTYDWSFEGDRQEGTILFAAENEGTGVQLAWVDSWHQSGGIMHLTGNIESSGDLKAAGSYSGGDELWGWTISFTSQDGQLKLTMENVTPAGEAEWAVEGIYSRV